MNAAFNTVVDELFTATRPRMVTTFTATLDCGAVVCVPGGASREEIVELVYEALDEQNAKGAELVLGALHSVVVSPAKETFDAAAY